MRNIDNQRTELAKNTIFRFARLMKIYVEEGDVPRQISQVECLLEEAKQASNLVSASKQTNLLNPIVDKISDAYPLELFQGAFDLAGEVKDSGQIPYIRKEILLAVINHGYAKTDFYLKASVQMPEDVKKALTAQIQRLTTPKPCVRPFSALTL